MTDEVFERRTRRFEETLEILRGIADTPWERFRADPEKYGSAERFLQIAVEILDDLGAHLVAQRGANPVDSYRDIPERLVVLGSIDEEQAGLWRRMIGLRNVIVRDYLDVDRAIVFDVLQHRLDDLRSVHRALLRAQSRP